MTILRKGNKILFFKSASRLVPGIGLRGGPGGRYSQVAMVSSLEFFEKLVLKLFSREGL